MMDLKAIQSIQEKRYHSQKRPMPLKREEGNKIIGKKKLKQQILTLRETVDDNLLIRESMELFKHF